MSKKEYKTKKIHLQVETIKKAEDFLNLNDDLWKFGTINKLLEYALDEFIFNHPRILYNVKQEGATI